MARDANHITVECWLSREQVATVFKNGFSGDRCDVFIDDDVDKPQLYRIYHDNVGDAMRFLELTVSLLRGDGRTGPSPPGGMVL